MSFVDDIQDHLQSQGLVDGATGWASVRNTMLDDKGDQLVMVAEDGGPAPEISTTDGIGDSALKDVGALLTVRAGPNSPDDSRSKAQAILDELHGQLGATIGSNAYLRVTALTGEPIAAGYDDKSRPLHTVAFRGLRDV